MSSPRSSVRRIIAGIRSVLPPRSRWLVRGVAFVLVVSLVAAAGVTTADYEPPNLQRGTVEDPADGRTVISIQGYHFRGEGNKKKPSRVVSVGPRGDLEWTYAGPQPVASWFYDVDPLENGHYLVTNAYAGDTLVYEYDPANGTRVWTERLDITDTHDVSMLPSGNLLIGNLHNSHGEVSYERVYVYNRTTGSTVWEWHFADHYPADTDEGITGGHDWTHVNDVDVVNSTHFLVSPRNFDQVIMIDRTTRDIVLRLGRDDDHEILDEQHNPTYLRGPDGEPTILVADSENDRVVEYACTRRTNGTCEWDRVWTVGTGQLNWPRDADRLPNGNTMVVDSLNQRVIEVTPTGRIVWEYYAPWAPYDAERPVHGEEAGGPTMRELGVSGSYAINGSAGLVPGTADRLTFASWLTGTFADTPLEPPVDWFAGGWRHVAPWVRPVWMSPWSFLALVVAGLVTLAWTLGEGVYQRRRIRRGFDRIVDRVSDAA